MMIVLDAGGSKTDAMLLSNQGKILKYIRGNAGNYQSIGLVAATQVYQSLIDALLVDISHKDRVQVCVYGLSGLDRPQDQQRLYESIISFSPCRPLLMNDTFLILRAGSPNNIGIAVVCGTGSNCVGIGADGQKVNIGGLGYEFGDWGGGNDLAVSAMRAAFRGEDGRSRSTLLTDKIKQMYHVKKLNELIDLFMLDAEEEFNWSQVTPLLFECAQEHDQISLDLLKKAGDEYALCVTQLAQKLFTIDDAYTLVLGGSVFQKATHPMMKDHMLRKIKMSYPNIQTVTLQAPPILGAVLYALDQQPSCISHQDRINDLMTQMKSFHLS